MMQANIMNEEFPDCNFFLNKFILYNLIGMNKNGHLVLIINHRPYLITKPHRY